MGVKGRVRREIQQGRIDGEHSGAAACRRGSGNTVYTQCATRSARGRAKAARLELQALANTEHVVSHCHWGLCSPCDWEHQGIQEQGSQALSPSPSQPSSHSLIPTGPRTLLIGSKGCTRARAEDKVDISIHSSLPGMLVASYSLFCSSDLCNEASNRSVLLSHLPHLSMASRHGGTQIFGS